MEIRVLIADDHSVIREGLRLFLEQDTDIKVVAEAADGREVLELARQCHPNVVLMDVVMPEMDGIAATESLRREFPDVEVIMLTNVLDRANVVRAVKAGAIGYLLKDIQAAELCQAVHAAAQGQVQLSPQVSGFLMREVQTSDSPKTLTEREADVLRMLAQGHSNKDIARHLHVVEDTVKSHVRHILSKLGLQSRTQAALYAIRQGLVLPDQEPQAINPHEH
jgi:NarL family two-component system response regulator LiaR